MAGNMTLGLELFYIEIIGTVVWGLLRLRSEKFSWRIAMSWLWPLIVFLILLGLFMRWVGGKDWDKVPKRNEDEDKCPVCHKGELVPFDELEERAEAVIAGKSEDIAADCKLFAPIVLKFIKDHKPKNEHTNHATESTA